MPQWWTFKAPVQSDYDRPDFKAWFQARLDEANQKNAEVQKQVREQYLIMQKAANFLYGADSNEVRYLRNKGEPSAASVERDAKKVWKRWEDHISALQAAKDAAVRREQKAVRDALKKQEREAEEKRQLEAREARLEAQRVRDADYRRRSAEAVAEMEAHGLVSGLDFDPNKAISTLRRYRDKWDERDLELEKDYRDYDV